MLKAIERVPVSAHVLIAPEPPKELREPVRPHVVRDIPDAYGRAELGWETLPERLIREHRDLTLADVLRIQHMLGQKPFESGRARRQVLAGVPVDRSALPDVPRLVIGAGLDIYVPEAEVERLAEWLGAAYEPFGAHSHFGLVWGSRATSRWPRRSGVPRDEPPLRPPRPTRPPERAGGCGLGAAPAILPPGRSDRPPLRRIRLEAQDTALSRRRPPVRIRYAVPATPPDAPGRAPGAFLVSGALLVSREPLLSSPGAATRPGR